MKLKAYITLLLIVIIQISGLGFLYSGHTPVMTASEEKSLINTNNVSVRVFDVSGGGSFCEGQSGVTVTLSGSEYGVSYYLVTEGDVFTFPQADHYEGGGGQINWLVKTSGRYDVLAFKDDMFYPMNGTVEVDKVVLQDKPLNNTGTRCFSTSSEITLSGSQTSVAYRLYRDGTLVKNVFGNNSTISFGDMTIEGSYKVSAYRNGCSKWMSGEVILTKKPLSYNVSGIENSCEGPLAGSSITLNGSQNGVSYKFYRDGAYLETVSGTGYAISSATIYKTNGVYSVVASNGTCTLQMNGQVNMTINPVPSILNIDNPGTRTVCENTSTTITLRNTEQGVIYTANGISQSGGGDLTWLVSAPGSYNVSASYSTPGNNCAIAMNGSVTLINPDYDGTLYTVAGGGGYCAGSSVSIYLEGNPNVNDGLTYSLMDSGIPVPGSEKPANGTVLSWDNVTGPAQYSVAVSSEGCYFHMLGQVDVYEKPLPQTKTLNFPSGFCENEKAFLTISDTEPGVIYRLFDKNGFGVFNSVIGDGTDQDIELLAETNTYTLLASLDGCKKTILNNEFIKVDPQIAIDYVVSNYLLLDDESTTITVFNIGDYDSFQWSKDGVAFSVSDNEYVTDLSGIYDLTATIGTCQATARIDIGRMDDYEALNNIVENTSYAPIKDDAEFGIKTDKFSQVIGYIDGLGRSVQSVGAQASVSHGDVIKPVAYDALGRVEYEYLPYVSTSNSGTFRHNALNDNYLLSDQSMFYQNSDFVPHDNRPYTTIAYEASTLNRIKSQQGPGESWNGKTTSFDYQANAEGEIIMWGVDPAEGLINEGYYTENTLKIMITTDENGHKVREFQNHQEQTILKQVQANEDGSLWANTYYVYNDLGNLIYILPPQANKELVDGAALDDDFLADWAFSYRYDKRQRMVQKRVPGSDWVYMVYDNRDRLVLTQDGNQGQDSTWTFTKYDQLNRPVATGTYKHATGLSPSEMQTYVNGRIGDEDGWYEAYNGDSTLHGYTDQAFPKGVAADDYLTVTYYDSYGFKSLPGFAGFNYDSAQLGTETCAQGSYTFPSTEFDRVKGQVTGQKVKMLDQAGTWLHSVTYYDDRYRPIQTVTQNYAGGIDRLSTLYNFPGWVLATKTSHKNGTDTYDIKRRFTYDHTGRLMQGYHEVIKNGASQGEVLLAENKYNELGELIEKNLHVENDVPHQSIDYRYNIRGWLESINNSSLIPGTDNNPDDSQPDLFGMELMYNNPLTN